MDAERRAEAQAEVRGNRRSTGLIVGGILLFFVGGSTAANNPDNVIAGLLFALLGIGLLVAGIVVRPRN